MLTIFVGLIIFVNYELIGWMTGSKHSEVSLPLQVKVMGDILEQRIKTVNLSPFSSARRSRTHIPTRQNDEATNDLTFFDKTVISALVEEDEKIKDIEKLDIPNSIPEEKVEMEGPIINEQKRPKNDGMLDDIPFDEEPRRVSKIVQAEDDMVNNFPNLSLDLSHLRDVVKEGTEELENSPRHLIPKADYARMNSRPINNIIPDSEEEENDDDDEARVLQDVAKFNQRKIAPFMPSGDDLFKKTKSNYQVPVQGKITVDLPDSKFSGNEFEPGKTLVKSMMNHAWKGYKDFAWGKDELKPWTKSGKNMLGSISFGLTAIDALDTLFLMDMKDEFERAADFIITEVDFKQSAKVSLFETNIRVLGGLLSAYALSKDDRLLKKATEVGDLFMLAFGSTFPPNDIILGQKVMPYSGRQVSLAQVGTFSLEFGYLSHLTGNPIYRKRAEDIIEEISKMTSNVPGLMPTHIFTTSTHQAMDSKAIF